MKNTMNRTETWGRERVAAPPRAQRDTIYRVGASLIGTAISQRRPLNLASANDPPSADRSEQADGRDIWSASALQRGRSKILDTATHRTVTDWHLVVDTSLRRATLYLAGRPVRAFPAVVGKPSTPTPAGEFYIEESIALHAGDVGAPFALALSARSDVLQEFDGGPGQIAVHGRRNVGDVPGTAASHGRVRFHGKAMRWLVARVGPGVPVTIKR